MTRSILTAARRCRSPLSVLEELGRTCPLTSPLMMSCLVHSVRYSLVKRPTCHPVQHCTAASDRSMSSGRLLRPCGARSLASLLRSSPSSYSRVIWENRLEAERWNFRNGFHQAFWRCKHIKMFFDIQLTHWEHHGGAGVLTNSVPLRAATSRHLAVWGGQLGGDWQLRPGSYICRMLSSSSEIPRTHHRTCSPRPRCLCNTPAHTLGQSPGNL